MRNKKHVFRFSDSQQIMQQTARTHILISIACLAVFILAILIFAIVLAAAPVDAEDTVATNIEPPAEIQTATIESCEFLIIEETLEIYEFEATSIEEQEPLPIIREPLPIVEKPLLVVEESKEQKIDEDFDILTSCGYTQAELEYAVSDHRRDKMLPYVDTLLEAEERYGVNALYLMSKLGLESGWCKYESGDNNIGGWTNIYGEFMDFESVDHCILYIAEKLSTSFKDDVGTRLEDVCSRYNTSDDYLDKIISIMQNRQDVIENYREENCQ